jgi:hypothetical protein
MARKKYTENEVVLCAFIALYEGALISEKKISKIGGRSEGSVVMKVQNIAALLDDKNIPRSPTISALTGLPAGESGRETDWSIVQSMVGLGKAEHWSICKSIIAQQ